MPGAGDTVAGRMAIAWLITLPAAGVVGAITWGIAHLGGGWGVAIMLVVLIAAAAAMFRRSRVHHIHPDNVNDEWDGGLAPSSSADATPQPAHRG